MGNGNSWFVENIPILGPIVGVAGVIVSGFLYQDRKISNRRTVKDCDSFRADMKETIGKSEKNIKEHLDLKLGLFANEIKDEIKSNGQGK